MYVAFVLPNAQVQCLFNNFALWWATLLHDILRFTSYSTMRKTTKLPILYWLLKVTIWCAHFVIRYIGFNAQVLAIYAEHSTYACGEHYMYTQTKITLHCTVCHPQIDTGIIDTNVHKQQTLFSAKHYFFYIEPHPPQLDHQPQAATIPCIIWTISDIHISHINVWTNGSYIFHL